MFIHVLYILILQVVPKIIKSCYFWYTDFVSVLSVAFTCPLIAMVGLTFSTFDD